MDLQLEASRASIPAGRRWVTQCAREHGVPERTCSTMALLTSELVTNAVKYGPPGGRILVHTHRSNGSVVVSVRDGNHTPPVTRHPGPEDVGGRGLQLVEQLSDEWGVDLHEGDGKSVWFRLPVQA